MLSGRSLWLLVRFSKIESVLSLLTDAGGDGHFEQLNAAPENDQGNDGNYPHFREKMPQGQPVNQNKPQHCQADQQPARQLAPPVFHDCLLVSKLGPENRCFR